MSPVEQEEPALAKLSSWDKSSKNWWSYLLFLIPANKTIEHALGYLVYKIHIFEVKA